MTNNDALRRLRFTLSYDNAKMLSIFDHVGYKVENAQLTSWLAKDEDERYKSLPDEAFANFLNGLIIERRGKREGPSPAAETTLNNNIVLRKLKIAFDLQSKGMLEILELADFRFSEHELSALFRKAGHKHFRPCKDQVLRNFLMGLQLKFAPKED
ncbi:DUF1456 family protein [Psychrosphaera sp. B3R10]|uniref:DUF1456 family protein n=1 Tax=Psychrosphaera algicola TaxID=3023714 RepID=A0ABT5FFW0_9GAMM|nr:MULTISPECIES: DUF1456 family protein [unclassified Psychrosphaera]MBU2883053.1 DUF1456 family protein [Psychrosphaera sp. I2R16]MBU2988510.1 DUF1456 family protein [Psychrosphaera sp. B3R10]MDC2890440.1 DUF1456 family protein [Psychrosphaera sp. G1-22]MDO6719570.1 DUF1456 family protein [Psychrosphaera sp. 1_MG-2023]